MTISDRTARRIMATFLLLGFAYTIFLWSEFVYNQAYEAGMETGQWGHLITPTSRVSVWHHGIPDSTYRDGYFVATKVDTILHADMIYQATTGQTTMKSTTRAFPDSTFYFVGGYIAFNIRTYIDSSFVGDTTTLWFWFSESQYHFCDKYNLVKIDGENRPYTVCAPSPDHGCNWDDMRLVGKAKMWDITVVPRPGSLDIQTLPYSTNAAETYAP